MKKKIVEIFICMLLIATAIPIVSSINKSVEKNDDHGYTSDEIVLNEDCGCGKTNKIRHRFGIMEERVKPLNLDEAFIKPTIMNNLPEYFNWMDFEGQDWTTPAKNQDVCGSCWLFAATAALDSIINIREDKANLDLDLSEQYVLSCLPRAGDCYWGGRAYNAFYYIMSNKSSGNNCNGIIPESCFPYRIVDAIGCDGYDCDHDPVLCDEKSIDWEEYLIPISNFGRWYPDGSSEDIDRIKTQVMQDGPVATAMMATLAIDSPDNFLDWGYEHRDPDDYYSSLEQFNTFNHYVVIVGWKDDPSIGNGGYWICKNSWGTDWGYDGFFNLEYGCLNIDNFEITWVDYNPNLVINWQPIANADGVYYGNIGEEITFDGSRSFDHEGEVISYEWDFGDGDKGFGETTTHTYESQGVYSVLLNVVDNDNNAVNDTTYAFIGRSNDPPNTTVNGPPNGKKGIAYKYNFSAIDPDGDDIYYHIYWGDDWRWEGIEPLKYWIGPFSSGEEITLNHTWLDEATYTIGVLVKDCYDFKSDWTTFKLAISKSKTSNFYLNIIDCLFDSYPNVFPIIKQLLGLTHERHYENINFWR